MLAFIAEYIYFFFGQYFFYNALLFFILTHLVPFHPAVKSLNGRRKDCPSLRIVEPYSLVGRCKKNLHAHGIHAKSIVGDKAGDSAICGALLPDHQGL